ncbi:MAG: hypothetical protein EOP46_17330 [Sphingobacteriaceae bacterium]|nr:MAG: hypothetical protein EOP46_17330 [Sphingobacteriaceae bacterium]
MKFFLNSDNKAYLRSLESEFGESSNAIRVELNRFEDVGLLVSSSSKNKKVYQANKEHSLFKEIHNISSLSGVSNIRSYPIVSEKPVYLLQREVTQIAVSGGQYYTIDFLLSLLRGHGTKFGS